MEMEALINTPTKIFAKVHMRKTFTLSSRSSSAVSWRHEICLRKSSTRTGLGLLCASLSHRKACHSLGSSNSEVHSGTDTAKTKAPQIDGSKVAKLRLELKKECQYGEHFLVAGEDPVLGSWNPVNAIPLSWSDGHIWTVDLELPIGETIHYKFICKLSTGDIVWQPGQDRTIRLAKSWNDVVVREDWENAESQNIIIQERLAADTPETKSSDPFGGWSNPNKKLMVRAENGFNISGSAKTASIADDTSVTTHRSRENSGARHNDYCVTKDSCFSTEKTKDDMVSLVIYDEGHVLVPGLTLHVITEEALAKELKNTVLGSSFCGTEGESLVKYDEGEVLAPGLSAQMITEEALVKEMHSSVLGNSLNGADKSVKIDEV